MCWSFTTSDPALTVQQTRKLATLTVLTVALELTDWHLMAVTKNIVYREGKSGCGLIKCPGKVARIAESPEPLALQLFSFEKSAVRI